MTTQNTYDNKLTQTVKQTQVKINKKTEADSADLKQDPANIATGANIINKTDLNYQFINTPIQINRRYDSKNPESFAFGTGWNFNYDSRIIYGVKPQYQEHVNTLKENLSAVNEQYNALFNEQTGYFKLAKELVDAAIIDARSAVEFANQAVAQARQAVKNCEEAIAAGEIAGEQAVIAKNEAAKAIEYAIGAIDKAQSAVTNAGIAIDKAKTIKDVYVVNAQGHANNAIRFIGRDQKAGESMAAYKVAINGSARYCAIVANEYLSSAWGYINNALKAIELVIFNANSKVVQKLINEVYANQTAINNIKGRYETCYQKVNTNEDSIVKRAEVNTGRANSILEIAQRRWDNANAVSNDINGTAVMLKRSAQELHNRYNNKLGKPEDIEDDDNLNLLSLYALQKKLTTIYNDAIAAWNNSKAYLPENYQEPISNAAPESYKHTAKGMLTYSLRSQANALTRLQESLDYQEDLLAQESGTKSYMLGLIKDLEARLADAEDKADLARNNENRNRYNLDPAYTDKQFFGNEYIKYVDEDGIDHLYQIVAQPDYGSKVTYADGSPNFYPQGSDLKSELPNDEEARLNSNGTITIIQKDQTKIVFNLNGRLQEKIDLNNNKIKFNFNGKVLLSVTDDFNRKTMLNYTNGKISSITDPKGRVYKYEYNGNWLKAFVNPEGDRYEYEYGDGVMVRQRLPGKGSLTYEYQTNQEGEKVYINAKDAQGYAWRFDYHFDENYTISIDRKGKRTIDYYNGSKRTVQTTNSDNTNVFKRYDENGNLIQETSENGYSTYYTYDIRRNLTSVTTPIGTSILFTYNTQNQITSLTDGNNHVTSFIYDLKGNMVQKIYPDGASEYFSYNAIGLPVTYRDRNGNTIEYSYSNYGYIDKIIYPDGKSIRFVSDCLGQGLKNIDAKGAETDFEFDLLGQITKIRNALGITLSYTYNADGKVATYTDGTQNTTTFGYDTRSNLNLLKDALGYEKKYEYTPEEELANLLMPDGSTYSYQYNERGRLIQARQNDLGVATQYLYDSVGNITQKIDGEGNTWHYGFDSLNRLIRMDDPQGNTTTYEYDGNNNLIRETDANDNSEFYVYDSLNRLIQTKDALNHSTNYRYDRNGNLIEITDAKGNKTQYQYDCRNRLVKKIDPLNHTTLYEYDEMSNLTKLTDSKGNSTFYEYDLLGRVTKIKDALGGSRQFTYDNNNNVLSSCDENQNITGYSYDKLNRLVKEIDPYGKETLYEYDFAGRIIGITDALGNKKTFGYDAMGRKIKETNELGRSKLYEYDKNSNLIKTIDELNRITCFTYDALGQLTKERNALNEERIYQYDSVGNLLSETDPNSKVYSYQYDQLNRLIKEINRKGNQQVYGYDDIGNLTSKTDFTGKKTIYEYDALGQLTKVLFADESRKEFDYDFNGNLIRAENDFKSLSFEYDSLNQLIRASDYMLDQTISYQYDLAGNRTRATLLDGTRTINYQYGKINELLAIVDNENQTTRFEYDALGREIKRQLPNSVITRTQYDPAGQVKAIININDKNDSLRSLAYLYNAAGERTYEIDETGKVTAYEYDKLGRIQNVYYPFLSDKKVEDFKERIYLGLYPAYDTSDSSKSTSDFNIALPMLSIQDFDSKKFNGVIKDLLKNKEDFYKTYRRLDQKVFGTWNVTPGEGATQFAQRLNPDSQTRMELQDAYNTIAGWKSGFDTNEWVWPESFSFDANSNRVSKTNGWGRIDYTYNADNEIINAGNRRYSHDLNGNLTKESMGDYEANYEYSPENRIVEIHTQIAGFIENKDWTLSGGVSYQYDALGRRASNADYLILSGANNGDIQKQWKAESNQSYLYDGLGMELLAEFYDTEFTGFPSQGNHFGWWKNRLPRFNPVSEYIFGNGALINRTDFQKFNYWTGKSRIPFQNKEYYSQDALGSTILLTDSFGRARETYSYDAFGNAFQGSFFRRNEIGFNGKIYDLPVRLYNYGYRDYNPLLGRWTTQDPLRDGTNWYAYCGNDPVNYIDPDGLVKWKTLGTGLLQTAGGVGQIAVGLGLIAAPEPTPLTKIAGVAVTGWGAINVKTGFDTIIKSFEDKKPAKNPIQTGLEKVGANIGKTIAGKQGEKLGKIIGKGTFLAIDTAINVKGTIDSIGVLKDIYKSSQLGYTIKSTLTWESTATKLFPSLAPSAGKTLMTGMGLGVDVNSYPSVIKDGVQVYKEITQSERSESKCKSK